MLWLAESTLSGALTVSGKSGKFVSRHESAELRLPNFGLKGRCYLGFATVVNGANGFVGEKFDRTASSAELNHILPS